MVRQQFLGQAGRGQFALVTILNCVGGRRSIVRKTVDCEEKEILLSLQHACYERDWNWIRLSVAKGSKTGWVG
jgi:hypothetical protein